MNVNDEIKKRKEEGLFRERKIISSAQGAQIVIGDKKFLNFSSNDYLKILQTGKKDNENETFPYFVIE